MQEQWNILDHNLVQTLIFLLKFYAAYILQ